MLTKHLFHDKNTPIDWDSLWLEVRDKGIEFLDLSQHTIEAIRFPTFALPALRVWDISRNAGKLASFSLPAVYFPHLTHLYLYESGLQAFEIVGDLPALHTLHLAKNALTHFEPQGVPALQVLHLRGNPIQNISPEIFDKEDQKYAVNNVWEDVWNHFVAQSQGQIINIEAKVIWFGNGEAGKTTLSYQFRRGAFSAEVGKKRTHGVWIDTWEIAIDKLPDTMQNKITQSIDEAQQANPNLKIAFPKTIMLKCWDFGGQEYYHATHRLFLNSNVLYLLVWDEATNKQEEKTGYYPLAYWQENIQYYAPENIILEVQNKVQDTCSPNPKKLQYKVDFRNEQDENSILQYNLDAKKLEQGVFSQLHNLNYLGKLFPKVYDDIRQALRTEETLFLPFSAYEALCQRNDFTQAKIMQDQSQIKTLTNFLHETGAIICYRFKEGASPLLKDHVFLKPEGVTNNIYKILSEELQGKGEFDLAHATQKINDSGISPEVWIALMQQFELIFEIKKKGKQLFVAPQYLPTLAEKSEKSEDFGDSMEAHQKQTRFVFALQYPTFMPKSNFLRFMVRYGAKSEPTFFYWKNGLVFFLAGKTVFAECRQAEKQIILQIQDADKTLAKALFDAFCEIDSTEKLEVSVGGTAKTDFVNFAKLKKRKEEGKSDCEWKDKDFQVKDFEFLMHQIIQNALKHLQNAQYAGYFEKMDKVMPLVTALATQANYTDLKNAFIAGDTTFKFATQLEIFAKEVDRLLALPATPPDDEKTITKINELMPPQPDELPVIFTAFANPKGDLQSLNDELNGIQDAFLRIKGIRHEHRIDTNLDAYFDFLQRFKNQIRIFHYGGHANSEVLSLQNANTLFSPIANELIGRNKASLQLVFLNGCSTYSHVKTLFKGNVPAVIATSAAVPDKTAMIFAVRFYKNLANGDDILEAYASATNYALGTNEPNEPTRWAEIIGSENNTNEFPWGLYVGEGVNLSGVKLF